jgi:hypothetical protein
MSIKTLCNKWQKLLRLQDWDITAEIKEDIDFENIENAAGGSSGSWGCNFVSSDRKCSKIYLKKACPDVELYLVHEIVHILCNPLDDVSVFMIDYIPNVDVKSVLSIQRTEALEKTVWGITNALYSIHKAQK